MWDPDALEPRGVELIDIKGMRSILVERPSEFWVALITAGVVIVVGVEQGILLAMTLSLLDHVRRGYRPRTCGAWMWEEDDGLPKYGHWAR